VRQGLVWVWAGGGGAAAAAEAAATPPVLAHELDQEAEGLPTRTRDGHPATARTYHYRELCAPPAWRRAQLLVVPRLIRRTACLPLVMCPKEVWPPHERTCSRHDAEFATMLCLCAHRPGPKGLRLVRWGACRPSCYLHVRLGETPVCTERLSLARLKCADLRSPGSVPD
jgi:hypothetical protein